MTSDILLRLRNSTSYLYFTLQFLELMSKAKDLRIHSSIKAIHCFYCFI